MPLTRRVDAPAPLLAAAGLAAAEGVVIGGYALLELVSLSEGRLTMGLTTGVFFAAYAVLLVWSGWALTRSLPWARSPVVLAQLIQLGLAWNFRGGSTTPVSIGLAVVALLVLVGLFHPASRKALERADSA